MNEPEPMDLSPRKTGGCSHAEPPPGRLRLLRRVGAAGRETRAERRLQGRRDAYPTLAPNPESPAPSPSLARRACVAGRKNPSLARRVGVYAAWARRLNGGGAEGAERSRWWRGGWSCRWSISTRRGCLTAGDRLMGLTLAPSP